MNQVINTRLQSLDILRGITIAGMILVNNPGSWNYVYAPLGHAAWIGLTPTDLVFPFFLFIMGISTYISLKKYRFTFSRNVAMKIIRRSMIIFAIGLGIAWLSLFFRTWNSFSGESLTYFARLSASAWTFDHLRILGVMQRLGICYGATAIIALTVKHKHIPLLAGGLLVGYFIVLTIGNGFAYNDTNILSVVDCALLGEAHLYKDNGIEPEGILSTIPAIAHTLIGFCVGRMLVQTEEIHKKMEMLFLTGAILTFGGFLLSYGCPIGKKIWSPTFVAVACGLASTLLALLIWLIDVRGHRRATYFFESFGVNPLFMYVSGSIISIVLGNILITYRGVTMSLQRFTYQVVLQPVCGNYPGSLVFALLFVAFIWCIGYILYRKKIYIKI